MNRLFASIVIRHLPRTDRDGISVGSLGQVIGQVGIIENAYA